MIKENKTIPTITSSQNMIQLQWENVCCYPIVIISSFINLRNSKLPKFQYGTWCHCSIIQYLCHYVRKWFPYVNLFVSTYIVNMIVWNVLESVVCSGHAQCTISFFAHDISGSVSNSLCQIFRVIRFISSEIESAWMTWFVNVCESEYSVTYPLSSRSSTTLWTQWIQV